MKKKLVILGAGESGTGAALLAKSMGYEIFVSDLGVIAERYKLELQTAGIAYEEGAHTEATVLSADEIIKSPGIPQHVPLLVAAREKKIPLVSEIEFAARFTKGKKICITGSNGKTTTTNLIFTILKESGRDVAMVGNVGTSFARQVYEEQKDFYVIELSSFQLEDMYDFRADISILLNITPDHLDRYKYDMDLYAKAKMRIVRNQTKDDCFIFCRDDQFSREYAELIESEVAMLPFGMQNDSINKAYIDNDHLIVNYPNTEFAMIKEDLALQGQHNAYNSMAAAITARALDIRDEHIRASLSSYKGVEHRLERYLSIRNVLFINDSKATNINATWYALDSMQAPTVWIVGGVDKGNDYSALDDLVKEKVKAIVCLGVDNKAIIAQYKNFGKPISEAQSMQEAVQLAYHVADKGDAVLLSPACASFDLFQNYEDRGTQFKENVRNL